MVGNTFDAMEGRGDSGTLHYLLGMHYMRESQNALAIKEFEKAVAMKCQTKKEQSMAIEKLQLLKSNQKKWS